MVFGEDNFRTSEQTKSCLSELITNSFTSKVLQSNTKDENIYPLKSICGYPGMRRNGQIIYGPPKLWVGVIPTQKSEVFVGAIPSVVAEDQLIPLFLKAGVIYDFRLMIHHNGSLRGFAFIRFTTEIGAQTAIKMFNNFCVIPQSPIGVVPSNDNSALLIDHLPVNIFPGDIITVIFNHIAGVRLMKITRSGSLRFMPSNIKSRRALLFFETHREAALARNDLQILCMEIWSTKTNISWAGTPIYHANLLTGLYDVGKWSSTEGLQMWIEGQNEIQGPNIQNSIYSKTNCDLLSYRYR